MLKDKTDNASWWIKLLWDGKTLNFLGKNGSKNEEIRKKKIIRSSLPISMTWIDYN